MQERPKVFPKIAVGSYVESTADVFKKKILACFG